jgi:hypothetical protein
MATMEPPYFDFQQSEEFPEQNISPYSVLSYKWGTEQLRDLSAHPYAVPEPMMFDSLSWNFEHSYQMDDDAFLVFPPTNLDARPPKIHEAPWSPMNSRVESRVTMSTCDITYPCEDDDCEKVFQRSDARIKHYRKQHPHLASSFNSRRSSNRSLEYDNLAPSIEMLATSYHPPSEELHNTICCEMCSAEFSGEYGRGNLGRHIKQKHRAPRLVEVSNHDMSRYFDMPTGTQYRDDPEVVQPTHTLGRRGAPLTPEDLLIALRKYRTTGDNTDLRLIYMSKTSPSQVMAMARTFRDQSRTVAGEKHALLDTPYGLIYMRKRRWSDAFATACYVVSQLAFCLALRNYELCQGKSTPHCGPSATSGFFLDIIWARLYIMLHPVSAFYPLSLLYSPSQEQLAILSPLLRHWSNPSTFLFVCIALLYGTAVILQYRLNRRDAYQYLSVPIGIISGLCMLAVSAGSSHGSPRMASTLAFCVSATMMLSVCIHALWREIIAPRKLRLQRKIDEWMRESALEASGTKRSMRFCEIY